MSWALPTREARRVAALENAVVTQTHEEATDGSQLMSIFEDMAAKEQHSASHQFATGLEASIRQYANMFGRGVRKAPFYVLVGASMPAVLLESGFLSNDTEAARLDDPAFQKQYARAIVKAILDFLPTLQARRGQASVNPGDDL